MITTDTKAILLSFHSRKKTEMICNKILEFFFVISISSNQISKTTSHSHSNMILDFIWSIKHTPLFGICWRMKFPQIDIFTDHSKIFSGIMIVIGLKFILYRYVRSKQCLCHFIECIDFFKRTTTVPLPTSRHFKFLILF